MSSPRSSLSLALSLALFLPASAACQDFGILFGAGRTTWSGPAGGAWSPSLDLTQGTLTGQWRLGPSLAGRLELGGGGRVADLGRTGLFEQETHVTFTRVQLGALLRRGIDAGGGGRRLFLEGGGHGWLETSCDVDLEGGPGFLGGETVPCAEWVTEDDAGPLVPRGSGIAWTVGTGLELDRWAFGVRYEREGAAVLGTPRGSARPDLLQVTGEWIFASPGRDASVRPAPASPRPAAEAPASMPGRGGPGDALVAGLLETGVPTLGYFYANSWSEGVLPNAVRMSGPVVAVVGWGTDSEALLIGGILMYAAGTVWAVVGAARRGWRMTPPARSGSGSMLLPAGPSPTAGHGERRER